MTTRNVGTKIAPTAAMALAIVVASRAVAQDAASVTSPPPAGVHNRVGEAQRRFDGADFEGVVELIDRTDQWSGLSRADLVELLALRAQAHIALDDVTAAERDLIRLATLEPGYRFPASVRPETVDAFTRVAAGIDRISVRLTGERQPGAVLIRAEVVGDRGDLVTRVHIVARPEGRSRSMSDTAELQVSTTVPVDAFVEAISLGGAVVARSPASGRETRFLPLPLQVRGGEDPWPWIAGIGGVAVAIAGAIAIGIIASQPPDRFQTTTPVIVGWP